MAKQKAAHGSWAKFALPHLETFMSLGPGERAPFIRSLSEATGLSANSLWRQFSALQYLKKQGADPNSFADNAPALMSIETVARVGQLDRAREAELFRQLVAGRGTVQYFQEARARLERTHRSELPEIATLTLSSILRDHLPPDDTFLASFQIQFPVSGPLWPLVVVDQSGRGRTRTVLLRADHANAISRERDFQALFEGTVLRSLVTCDRVIVGTNMPLPTLEKTINQMRPELQPRLLVLRCDIDVDLREPYRNEQFATANDYLETCRIG